MRVGIDLRPLRREASGGVVRFIEDLCPALFAAGPSETFLVYSSEGGYRLPGPLPASVHQVTLVDASAIHLDRALARERVDVLFRAFPSDEKLAFPASRQCVLLPDLQHEDFPQFFSPDEIAARRRGFGAVVTRGGAVGLLSRHAEERLHAIFPCKSARVVHLPPGPPTLDTVLETPLTAAERSVIPRGPFFLYPANLWEHKNHRRVLAAFARFLPSQSDRFSLVLTGSGGGLARVMENATTLPVRHLGFVSRRLLAELYQRCAALVYFSLYEGFGLPVLEAFQLGAPVLCSDTTSLASVGGDAALRCDPTDIEAMAGLMRHIVAAPELRQTLVRRGQDRLRDYTWTRPAENLLASLEELAGAPPRHDELLDAIGVLTGPAPARVEIHRSAHATLDSQAREIENLHLALNERTAWAEDSLKSAEARLEVIGAQQVTIQELQQALADWTARGAAMADEYRLVTEAANERLRLIEQLHGHPSAGNGLPGKQPAPRPDSATSRLSRDDETGHERA
jgi:glycosyltransferase involved in cell wall biosynthesis